MTYKITAKQGNLLNEKSTFIVNPSNTKLLLGSGVSMALKRYCGKALQDEMDSALDSVGGDIAQGDVFLTPAINATGFQYVLHAAVMNYNKGVRGDEKRPSPGVIREVLKNIEKYLYWYAKYKSNTMKLTLPLIGCGVGGLKKIDVIKIYKEFFSGNIPFKCEIVIYGYSNKDYELVRDILSDKKIENAFK